MSLSAVPNLEQQKKQARELLRGARARDPEALERFRAHHPRLAALPASEWPPSDLALHDAQLVLARELGFPSWPKLKAHIEAADAARHTRAFVSDPQYHEDRAAGLLAVLGDGAAATLEQVRAWHPAFAAAPDEAIRGAAETGAFTLEDARLVYAREHGFDRWPLFVEYLRRLQAGKVKEPFMEALEAGRRLDWPRGAAILQEHPNLVRARGTNGNTLLNLACSMVACPAPDAAGEPASASSGEDRLAPVRLLLQAGADPNQGNDRGWTPLHQAGYRNDPPMVQLLLGAGARIDLEAHGAGGTPLAVALFWGHREAADTLASAGVVPDNLRIAAGLGRVDLVTRCFTPGGDLTSAACAARGFYRPHSGFPAWRPSGDPQEVLDEALVWAARANRVEAMALLAERGARIDADPYRGTPLIWAAANGRLEAVAWLLDHGAEVNRRATFGGPTHGEGVTALHLAAQDDRLAVAELLVARGADPTIEDGIYHSTAAGWAEHFGARRVARLLRGLEDR